MPCGGGSGWVTPGSSEEGGVDMAGTKGATPEGVGWGREGAGLMRPQKSSPPTVKVTLEIWALAMALRTSMTRS
jgi:hypothetical protein